MNGFDFLLLAILTSIGSALLLAKGYGLRACAEPESRPQQTGDETQQAWREDVRHAHALAGTRWLAISGLAFLLAVTRGRDTMFLVEHLENVLMPCVVLTTAWVITNARADRAGCKVSPPTGDAQKI